MKILIDYNKCNNAVECKKCLDCCPTGVFMIFPEGGHISVDINLPKRYKVYPFFLKSCILCMECVKKCPKKSISITEV